MVMWEGPEPRSHSDDRSYKSMVSASLAFKDLISWHHIPVLNEDDEQVLEVWPMILPQSMA